MFNSLPLTRLQTDAAFINQHIQVLENYFFKGLKVAQSLSRNYQGVGVPMIVT